MSDIVERLRNVDRHDFEASLETISACEDAADEIVRLRAEVARLKKLDREAATYVESVICMRTRFTGDPPYVGWKGLGLALRKELDERDRLREALTKAVETMRQIERADFLDLSLAPERSAAAIARAFLAALGDKP